MTQSNSHPPQYNRLHSELIEVLPLETSPQVDHRPLHGILIEYSTKSVIDFSHSVVSSVAALKMQFIHSLNNSSTCSYCVFNMNHKAFHGPLAYTFQLSSAVLSRHWDVNWFNKPIHMVDVHSLDSALTPLSNHYTRQSSQSRHPVYFPSFCHFSSSSYPCPFQWGPELFSIFADVVILLPADTWNDQVRVKLVSYFIPGNYTTSSSSLESSCQSNPIHEDCTIVPQLL